MKLSIITICYNEVCGIEQTLKSVISQTYDNYQYIVIDGNSSDGTTEIIEKYTKHIDIYQSEPDSGIYNAMNKGLKYAKGEYIIFLNGGDYFCHKNILMDVKYYFGNADIIYGYLKTPNGKIVKNLENVNIKKYLKKLTLPHQATFVKREFFIKTFGFNEKLKIAGDYEFFVKCIYLHNALALYIPICVSVFNLEGIAENYPEIREQEKKFVQMKARKYCSFIFKLKKLFRKEPYSTYF